MHLGAFRAASAQVLVLCGAHREKTQDVARRAGVPYATTSIAELCEFVGTVVVASPDQMHAEHVRAAPEASKLVVRKKPLTHTLAEARDLLIFAKGQASLMAVNFMYRFLSPFTPYTLGWRSLHFSRT